MFDYSKYREEKNNVIFYYRAGRADFSESIIHCWENYKHGKEWILNGQP